MGLSVDSPSDEKDPYFNSLVDNFLGAADINTDLLTSSPEIDYRAASQRQSLRYAESALQYYNNSGKKKIKYELIRVITSNAILSLCYYGHVNLVAKGDFKDLIEEFFSRG
uniref:Uncharacterized protein n=1 Tax=Leersia perrieri TaxID=77586 RepID=A0A0D9WAG4_9ORYZ